VYLFSIIIKTIKWYTINIYKGEDPAYYVTLQKHREYKDLLDS